MEEKLKNHIDEIFSTVPCTQKAVEMREEILQNLIDRYHDLLADGKSEEAAYNGAVEGIGDVNELLATLNLQSASPANNSPTARSAETDGSAAQTQTEQPAAKQKSALLIAIAVMMYILSPVPCIIFDDDVIGPVLLFVIVAAATGIIIYRSTLKGPRTANQTAAPGVSNEQITQISRKKSLKRSLSAMLWALVLTAYFVVSFTTCAWYITWLIFPIGAALDSVLRTAVDLTN